MKIKEKQSTWLRLLIYSKTPGLVGPRNTIPISVTLCWQLSVGMHGERGIIEFLDRICIPLIYVYTSHIVILSLRQDYHRRKSGYVYQKSRTQTQGNAGLRGQWLRERALSRQQSTFSRKLLDVSWFFIYYVFLFLYDDVRQNYW